MADEQIGGDLLSALLDQQGTVRDLAKYTVGTDTTDCPEPSRVRQLRQAGKRNQLAVDHLFAYTAARATKSPATKTTATAGNTVADKRVEFTYNLAGQFDTLTRHADLSGSSQIVATSTYAYDLTGRLDTLTHAKSGTIAGYDFGYDAANRLTSFANSQASGENRQLQLRRRRPTDRCRLPVANRRRLHLRRQRQPHRRRLQHRSQQPIGIRRCLRLSLRR